MNSESFESISGKKGSTESWLRVAFFCVGIIVLACIMKFQAIDWDKNKEKFYKEGFSALVMYRENNSGRLNEYHLANELKVYFKIADTTSMAEGDSVVKDVNTYYYNVYRKSADGGYRFFARYNFDESPFK